MTTRRLGAGSLARVPWGGFQASLDLTLCLHALWETMERAVFEALARLALAEPLKAALAAMRTPRFEHDWD